MDKVVVLANPPPPGQPVSHIQLENSVEQVNLADHPWAAVC
jgi:hypothetical protein